MSTAYTGTGSEAAALLEQSRISGARLSSALYDILKSRLLEGRYGAEKRSWSRRFARSSG